MKTLLLFSILLFNIMLAMGQDTLYWKNGKVTLCELRKLNLKFDKVEATDFGKNTFYNIPLRYLLGAGGYGKNKELADAINARIAVLTAFPAKSRYKKNGRLRGRQKEPADFETH